MDSMYDSMGYKKGIARKMIIEHEGSIAMSNICWCFLSTTPFYLGVSTHDN